MDRDELIRKLGQLMAGLAAPVSMRVPVGAAEDTWGDLHRGLAGFGWASAGDYEAALRRVLGPEPAGAR